MGDRILRATAAGGNILAIAADTRELVQKAFELHHTMPVATAALGRLLTAGAIMATQQKGENDLLTLKIEGDGPLKGIVVTANSKSQVRGFVYHPETNLALKPNGKLDVSGAIGNGTLTVIKDMGLKEPYVGKTLLQTGEIAEDLTYYYMASEQIASSVGLGVLVDRDYSVRQAGGFLIQLMPFTTEEVILRLEENLKNISSVTALMEEGKSTEEILALILDGLDLNISQEIVPEYVCNCSKKRIEKALISLGREEITGMIEDGETIEIHCDFCNQYYYYTVEELKELLVSAR